MTNFENNLLEDLKTLVDTLNNSLPVEISFNFSCAIDPWRAVVFREACLYRVAELAESAYEAFTQDRLTVAFILARAFMETEALFWMFYEKLETALKTHTIEDVRLFLTNAMIGVKDDQLKQFKNPNDPAFITPPTNILTFIQKMNKSIKNYGLHYASLSEFSHPNAAGTVDSYVYLDHDNQVARFGKNRRKLNSALALPQLVGSLDCFLEIYNRSSELLEQFTLMCENLVKNPS